MKKLVLAGIMVLVLFTAGCLSTKKVVYEKKEPLEITLVKDIEVPNGFEFCTKKVVTVNISGENLAGTIFEIYGNNPNTGGSLISKTFFDENGKFSGNITLPNTAKSIFIKYGEMVKEVIISGEKAEKIISDAPKRTIKRADTVLSEYLISPTEIICFEDRWPIMGDYDTNDVVIKTKYTTEFYKNSSGKNEIRSIKLLYKPIASGAGYNSGFGIELNVNKSMIKSVSGTSISSSNIKLENNGVESGQSKAVIIAFENIKTMFDGYEASNIMINTMKNEKNYNAQEREIVITFNEGNGIDPLDAANNIKFINPFIFRTYARGIEVHLKGYKPTDLAEEKLCFTGDDVSNRTNGIYYQTSKGLPWAISLAMINDTDKFYYPMEGNEITSAYLKFADWVTSGGTLYNDWYDTKNITKTGYFDSAKMYITKAIPDTEKPIIQLNGNANITVENGASYIELGATATDDVDGNISSKIIVNGTVNTGIAGEYTIKYNVSDSSGNVGIEVIRTVVVNPVVTPTGIEMIAVGGYHTAILKRDGTLWTNGYNNYGQLGDGTKVQKKSPVKIMSDVAYVSAGNCFTMILKKDGTLWATGDNGHGQLGDGTTIHKTTPVQVMTDVSSVSAGVFYTMIIKKDGTLWAVGENANGQLGDGTTTDKFVPTKIMNDALSVSATSDQTMIIKKDGTLWATGRNSYGQLGDGTTVGKTTPTQVLSEVSSVSAGVDHTMMLKKDGTLWGTGYNTLGSLGNGMTISETSPIRINFN